MVLKKDKGHDKIKLIRGVSGNCLRVMLEIGAGKQLESAPVRPLRNQVGWCSPHSGGISSYSRHYHKSRLCKHLSVPLISESCTVMNRSNRNGDELSMTYVNNIQEYEAYLH